VIIQQFCFPLRKISDNVNLIIEQGNTLVKVAVYDKGQMLTSAIYSDFDDKAAAALFEQYPLVNGIFSTVVKKDERLISFLDEHLHRFVFLNEEVALPIKVQYETKATLGQDRVAAAVGANFLKPDRDVLVIDAGTAITYELIEASGSYLGGNISPGMNMRFKALHQFTQKLPLITEEEEVPSVGISTETAIRAGVVNGIVYEMDGYMDSLRLKYPNLFVFLTGGNSFYFVGRLKNPIFADINLVLTGLNRILEYNVEN